jgi:hypothetical protein
MVICGDCVLISSGKVLEVHPDINKRTITKKAGINQQFLKAALLQLFKSRDLTQITSLTV